MSAINQCWYFMKSRVSLAEKKAWYDAQYAAMLAGTYEPKLLNGTAISSLIFFEPIDGWRPFEKYQEREWIEDSSVNIPKMIRDLEKTDPRHAEFDDSRAGDIYAICVGDYFYTNSQDNSQDTLRIVAKEHYSHLNKVVYDGANKLFTVMGDYPCFKLDVGGISYMTTASELRDIYLNKNGGYADSFAASRALQLLSSGNFDIGSLFYLGGKLLDMSLPLMNIPERNVSSVGGVSTFRDCLKQDGGWLFPDSYCGIYIPAGEELWDDDYQYPEKDLYVFDVFRSRTPNKYADRRTASLEGGYVESWLRGLTAPNLSKPVSYTEASSGMTIAGACDLNRHLRPVLNI